MTSEYSCFQKLGLWKATRVSMSSKNPIMMLFQAFLVYVPPNQDPKPKGWPSKPSFVKDLDKKNTKKYKNIKTMFLVNVDLCFNQFDDFSTNDRVDALHQSNNNALLLSVCWDLWDDKWDNNGMSMDLKPFLDDLKRGKKWYPKFYTRATVENGSIFYGSFCLINYACISLTRGEGFLQLRCWACSLILAKHDCRMRLNRSQNNNTCRGAKNFTKGVCLGYYGHLEIVKLAQIEKRSKVLTITIIMEGKSKSCNSIHKA